MYSFYYSFPSPGSAGWELRWGRDSQWAAQVVPSVLYERPNGTLTEVRWSGRASFGSSSGYQEESGNDSGLLATKQDPIDWDGCHEGWFQMRFSG